MSRANFDPTNPLHRLAAAISADVAYALARVAALEEGMRTAEGILAGIPSPRWIDGEAVYHAHDDVPEDIGTALAHIRAALNDSQNGGGA